MNFGEIFNTPEAQGSIIIVFGVILVVIAILKLKRIGKTQCTISAQGTVYDIHDRGMNVQTNINIRNRGFSVKFPTKDMLWIQGKVSDIATSLYKEGETVDVLYNENDPNEFIVVSSKQTQLYKIFIIVGILISLLGICVLKGWISLN